MELIQAQLGKANVHLAPQAITVIILLYRLANQDSNHVLFHLCVLEVMQPSHCAQLEPILVAIHAPLVVTANIV
jgi:hypothetical protein